MALDVRDGLEDMMRVVDGPPEPVLSQFKLGYGSVALLLATGQDMATIRRVVESSFGQYQNLKKIRGLEAEVTSLEMALADGRRFEAPCGDFQRIGRYRAARAGRAAAHGAGWARRSAAEAEPGAWRCEAEGDARWAGHGSTGAATACSSVAPHGVPSR
jgi:hypothetical protein